MILNNKMSVKAIKGNHTSKMNTDTFFASLSLVWSKNHPYTSHKPYSENADIITRIEKK